MLRTVSVICAVFAAVAAFGQGRASDPKRTYQEAKAALASRRIELPEFWIDDLKALNEQLKKVERGDVKVIAKSPGGRPLHLACYGEQEKIAHKANFNSAVAGGDPSAYMNKASRKKPVVYFVGPVHGHEVEGLTGLMSLISVMETGRDLRGKVQPELRRLGEQCRLVILPQGNPDGIARFEPRCGHGMPLDELGFWAMGTWADDRIARYPTSKLRHPRSGPDIGFLGCYFDDAGVNPMHDEFLAPMSTEAAAILQVAREEGPDLAVSLHSNGVGPTVARPTYVPMEVQAETARLTQQFYALLDQRGLPHSKAKVFKPIPESGKTFFNLVSALYHISGATPFTFECGHGLAEKIYTQLSLEQILDVELSLYETMLLHALEAKRSQAIAR